MKVLFIVGILLLSTLAQDFQEEENVVETEEIHQEEERSKLIRPRKPQPASERIELTSKTYKLEYITVFIVIIYFVYFFIGKTTNSSVVTNYAREAHSPIFKYFKKGNRNSDVPVGIMSTTCNNFVIECYDHPIIKGACLNFNLIKRQEFFSHMFSLVSGDEDELVIDIVFNTGVAPPCIFGVCKARQEKKLRKQYPEINKFCKTRNGKQMKLSEKLVVVSDAFEVTGILTQPILEFIEKYENQFNYFLLSDQSTSVRDEKCLLRCSVKIGKPEVISVVTELFFGLSNSIKKVSLEARVLEKCKKVRSEIMEEEEKEKARKLREEIAEKLEEEKAKKINAMTAEERRRYEEKQRNKLVKRKQVKVKMG